MKRFLLFILFNTFLLNGYSQLFNIPVTLSGGSGINNNEVCGANVITLTADTIPAGMTYVWVVYTGACQGFPNEMVLSTGTPVLNYGGTGMIYCRALDSLNGVQGTSWPIAIVNPDINGGICDSALSSISAGFCAGDSIMLQCSQDITWSDYINSLGSQDTVIQWQKNSIDIPGAINNPFFHVTTTGYYRVKFILSCGTSYSNQMWVAVSPVISPNFLGDNSICAGTSTTLCVSPQQFYSCYLWNNGSSASCITVSNSGLYTVTVCNDDGCTATGSVAVTVYPLPVPSISGNTSLCQGSNTVLTASAGYSIYEWSTGANTQTINVSNSGYYEVTVTDSHGCSGSTGVIVTSNPIPVATISAIDTIICSGEQTNIVISFTGTPPFTYSYSDGTSTFGPFTTINTVESIQVSPGATTTYTVLLIGDANCAGTATGLANITVNPSPVFEITTSDSTLCQGQSTVLNAGGGWTSYLWSNGAVTQTITISFPVTISATVTNAFGCTGSDVITISAEPPYPTVLTASGPLGICQGDSVQLSAIPGQASYQWYKNNALLSGAVSESIWVKTTSTYHCLTSDNSGCPGASNQVLVKVICNTPGEDERVGLTNSEIEIFPNPATDRITIKLPVETDGQTEISLSDLSGRVVLSQIEKGKSEFELKLTGITPGYYLVKVKSAENLLIERVILK